MTAIRRPGAASAAVLTVLTASLVLAHAIAPDWSRRAGLDVWNMASLEQDLRVATAERDEVYAHAEWCALRRETADQIAAQLVSNTTTLAVATDEIGDIFANDRGQLALLARMYPDASTERLRFARHTIGRALRQVSDDPTRAAAVRTRLEAEYREMAAAHESPAVP